jgi:transposase-like protein
MSADSTTADDSNRYRKDAFLRASELQEKTRYCPRCEDLEATFRFKMFVRDGCNGHPRARYACAECGLRRHFGVLVDPNPDAGGGSR